MGNNDEVTIQTIKCVCNNCDQSFPTGQELVQKCLFCESTSLSFFAEAKVKLHSSFKPRPFFVATTE